MEAFRGRGKNDFLASHDLEDFIAVIDGRSSILEDVASAPAGLKEYLAQATQYLLKEPRFRDALPGYVLGDQASQERVPVILERLQRIGLGL